MSLPHSDACFVKAYPGETTEAFCDEHVAGVTFFGGVPRSILYDNTKIAVARILGDGRRQRTRVFSELQCHYLFEDRFGRPGKGNDKGKVEGLVGYCRRNFLVPMPRFQTFDGLNAHLEACCRKRWAERLRGHGETIGERLERDRAILQPLPATPYDACDKRSGRHCHVWTPPFRRRVRQDGVWFELQTEGASTMDITTIGFDLAKTVFQVHGADGEGRVVLRRKLRRGKVLAFFAGLPSCLVGMEACASAHYWARELQALGHKVRLIPPQYVRPFVKTNKNDAADAEAICEAVTRPTMRFTPAKSAEQQSVLMLHRARELRVRQRTMVINALRGHCAELGLIVAQGASRVWRNWLPSSKIRVMSDCPLWLARRSAPWLSSSVLLRPGSSSWRRHLWHGTDPTSRAAVWRRFPASVSSPRRRWSRRSAMARSSAQADSSRPGSVWCPDNTRVAARTGWGGYRSAGMAT